MNWLKSILDKFRIIESRDSFFGHMIYMKMPQGRISYWEAKRFFNPAGKEIELFIDAPAPMQLPNEMQRNFFQYVEGNYFEIMESVGNILQPEFERWLKKSMQSTIDEEFSLNSFSIPCESFGKANWSMSFDSLFDIEHMFTVHLIGKEAKTVTIDG